MSVGPMGGIAGSVAGSPLSQTAGSETERARQDAGSQQRRIDTDQKAEMASGIGEADGDDHETAERDADGRRLWEETPDAPSSEEGPSASDPPKSKDATGQSGTQLDLSG